MLGLPTGGQSSRVAFLLGSFKRIIGLACVVIGAAGLVLPLVPGTEFLVAGAAILGSDHPAVKPYAHHLKKFWKFFKKAPPAGSSPADSSSSS